MTFCPRCEATDRADLAEAFEVEHTEFEHLGFSAEDPDVERVKCLNCGTEFFRLSAQYQVEVLPAGATGTKQ